MGAQIVNAMPDSAHNATVWVVVALACGAVLAAIVAITRRTALATTLAMLGAGLCVAGLYAGLSWHFLGAIQLMLWAGGLLAFFVFSVMLLNRDDSDPVAMRGIITRIAAMLALFAVLFFVVNLVAWSVWPLPPETTGQGSTSRLGRAMFGDDLVFPLQMLAVGLLLGVLGALSLTRVASQERESP
ncbi:MAG: NADH-quinone oxidoreductase subunit J [Deltaproteobacteria bacterium]|nr:NADH-quinone oxidoreductase subunit J [Deltaproteobacteria bacterium]